MTSGSSRTKSSAKSWKTSTVAYARIAGDADQKISTSVMMASLSVSAAFWAPKRSRSKWSRHARFVRRHTTSSARGNAPALYAPFCLVCHVCFRKCGRHSTSRNGDEPWSVRTSHASRTHVRRWGNFRSASATASTASSSSSSSLCCGRPPRRRSARARVRQTPGNRRQYGNRGRSKRSTTASSAPAKYRSPSKRNNAPAGSFSTLATRAALQRFAAVSYAPTLAASRQSKRSARKYGHVSSVFLTPSRGRPDLYVFDDDDDAPEASNAARARRHRGSARSK
mmetsp:Transcript_8561/g.35258  ORF Transcript_8561/g.35258 Transcript_8561/m.35258 type:complete len:282 (+) Transcript_8561:560-1405(+)